MRGPNGVDDDTFSRLLQQIYDAALEPERWREALQAIADAAGGDGAAMQAADLRSNNLVALHDSGFPRELVDDFNRHFLAIDPRVAHIRRFGHGRLFHDGAFIDERGMDRSEYYTDFVGRYGWRYAAFMGMHADGSIQTAFSVQRTAAQGPVTAADEALLLALAPHLRRAVRLTVELGAARLQAASSAAALDRLSLGFAILDASGRVLHANAALRRIAAAEDGLALAAEGLRFGHRLVQARAMRLLADTMAAARGRGRSAGGTVSVARRSGRRPYVVTVAPLPGQAPLFLAARPAAIVLVADPEATATPPEATLRALYRLTPREAALAVKLAAGQSLREASAELAITERTARSHLAAIFLKTGTARQAELMRLLFSISSAA